MLRPVKDTSVDEIVIEASESDGDLVGADVVGADVGLDVFDPRLRFCSGRLSLFEPTIRYIKIMLLGI